MTPYSCPRSSPQTVIQNFGPSSSTPGRTCDPVTALARAINRFTISFWGWCIGASRITYYQARSDWGRGKGRHLQAQEMRDERALSKTGRGGLEGASFHQVDDCRGPLHPSTVGWQPASRRTRHRGNPGAAVQAAPTLCDLVSLRKARLVGRSGRQSLEPADCAGKMYQ